MELDDALWWPIVGVIVGGFFAFWVIRKGLQFARGELAAADGPEEHVEGGSWVDSKGRQHSETWSSMGGSGRFHYARRVNGRIVSETEPGMSDPVEKSIRRHSRRHG